jgi:hypothetical protein
MSIVKARLGMLPAVGVVIAGLLLVVASAAQGAREVGSFSLTGGSFDGVAVEQSSQDVFASDGRAHIIEKRSPGGSQLLTEFGGEETPAGKFGPLLGGVAIDESSSSSKGDVYIADGLGTGSEGLVYKFKPKAGRPDEYEYVCQLTGPGGGCTKEGGIPTTTFAFSVSVAVDSEGNAYVVSATKGVVYEFDSEGNYLGELVGENIIAPIAVAAGKEHMVYVTNAGGDTVKLTVNASHEVASETVLDPHKTGGVAVDPTTGNVYITDAEGGWHVVVYNPSGGVIEEFAKNGELSEASSIAYSAQDARTYVVEANKRVVVFAEPPVVEVGVASNVSSSGATLHGTVNPEGPSAEWYFEYGESTSYGSSTTPGNLTSTGEVSTVIEGLKPGTVYHYRLVAANSRGAGKSSDGAFVTQAVVGGLPASGVTQFSATLNGTIDPGVLPVSYHFAYGTTSAYESIAPIPDLYTPPGAAENVSQVIAGLKPGTTYHYALVIADVAGTITAPDQTFTTPGVPPPAASTASPSEISRSSAVLSGTVDPMGWDTTYRFQYGTSTAYDSSWPTVDVDMGALTGNQPVVIILENLQPGTTYHYRLVATNPGGVSYGTDQTFTTGSYPVSIVQTAPIGAPIGITPTKTSKPKSKPKSKTHKHPKTKHKKSKTKKR